MILFPLPLRPFLALVALPVFAQFGEIPEHRMKAPLVEVTPEPTEKRIYKEVDGVKLEVWIWKPAEWKREDRRSSIVFYHGGSWRGGDPTAFSRQSQQLAHRGMVAFSVQYRLTSQAGVTVHDCVRDAKSAFRWIVSHASDLGIDPHKVSAGGSSSGGHLAAALATLDAINDSAYDTRISTIPVALVLFAPALQLDGRRAANAAGARSSEEMAALSPFDHVKRGHPPTVIFHGEADMTMYIRTAREYAAGCKITAGSVLLSALLIRLTDSITMSIS